MAEYVTGAFGGVGGWWSARKAEQEREVAEAAEGACTATEASVATRQQLVLASSQQSAQPNRNETLSGVVCKQLRQASVHHRKAVGDQSMAFAAAEKRRREQSFGEEGLEDFRVPADLPIEAIAREVQESWQLKVRRHATRDPGWVLPYAAFRCTVHLPTNHRTYY